MARSIRSEGAAPARDARYGKGVVHLDDRPIESEAQRRREQLMALLGEVKGRLDAQDYQPPLLPEVALALSELSGRTDVDLAEVEAVVTRDPLVAARVLALANSADRGRGGAMKSLRGAIMRLGLAEVRDVAFQVVARTHIFRIQAYAPRMRDLLDAAQASGVLARHVCRALGIESDLAYLCGLLHDMGEALILGVAGQSALARREAPPSLAEVAPLIDRYHAAVGARICAKWQLPPAIAEAVLHHHAPEQGGEAAGLASMASVVAVTDLLLRHAGIGQEARPVDPMREAIFYRINLFPEQVAQLLSQAEDLAATET